MTSAVQPIVRSAAEYRLVISGAPMMQTGLLPRPAPKARSAEDASLPTSRPERKDAESSAVIVSATRRLRHSNSK